ncbi:E3 ubiquitin-protein ligase AMFR [Hondaea fermentalgiana]|uniref:E3 ubiquitin-protein ligase AMFR n=1 Tax=Hondaea fermentalgiana TaxID=2315210 RepID=A0A2R5G982_9STRA|nr:E3 ubiquitin-protein ligase AMFR [Hondaea fermentalgiana]|eukprot:GBG26348.1 E3 ubiquitin-protein ligase AMFR [Hondaea fermentalgiana]
MAGVTMAGQVLGRMVSCWVVRESLSVSGAASGDTGLVQSAAGAMRRSLVMGGGGAARETPPSEDGRPPGEPRAPQSASLMAPEVWMTEARRFVSYVFFNVLLVWTVLELSVEVTTWWAIWFTVLGVMRAIACLGPGLAEKAMGVRLDEAKSVRRGMRCLVSLLVVALCNIYLYRCVLRRLRAHLMDAIVRQAEANGASAARLDAMLVTMGLLFRLQAANIFIETAEQVGQFLVQHPSVDFDLTWDTPGCKVFFLDNLSSHVHLGVQIGHSICIWVLKGLHFNIVDLMLGLSIHENYVALRKCSRSLCMYRRRRATLLQRCAVLKTKPLGKTDLCSICMDRLETHIVQLPCKHLFHRGCLIRWFERCRLDRAQPSCPLCRSPCT